MPIFPETCRYIRCKNLLAPPWLERTVGTSYAKIFCSRLCADKCYFIATNTCRALDCHHIVAESTPAALYYRPKFDTVNYCTIGCARRHYREDPSKASRPLSFCIVCHELEDLRSFVHTVHPITHDARGFSCTNVAIPPYCRKHIMPEENNFKKGVCVECISSYLEVQFAGRGAHGITCPLRNSIHPGEGFEDSDWRPYAKNFLAEEVHADFQQKAFELWLSRYPKWICPNACSTLPFIIDPLATPDYPHVHCSGCEKRFCAACRVLWHEGMTCSEYRAQHSAVHRKYQEEAEVLATMAVLDARRCPSCLSVSTKGEGCSYVQCQCGAIFNWGDAGRVAPINNEEEQKGPTRAEFEQLKGDPTESTSLEPRLDTLLNATTLHKLLPGIMFDGETPMLLKETRNAIASTHATFTSSNDWSDDDKGKDSDTTDTIDPASPDHNAEADSRGDEEEQSDVTTPSKMCEMDRIIAERSSRRRDRILKSIRTW